MLPESCSEMALAQAIHDWDGTVVAGGASDHGEATIVVVPERVREVCQFLKSEQGFERLSNVTAVDRYPEEPRFELVYHLHSIARNERVRLKCRLHGAAPEIGSVLGVWRSADWYEREVFDLFGIVFTGRPNLRRLLLPEDWEGHPLRKDFPVHGHRYDYKDGE